MITELFVVCLLVVICLLFYVKLWKYFRFKNEVSRIPGFQGYPIVGDVLRVWGTPEETFVKIREVVNSFKNCFIFWIGPFPVVCITSPEDMEIVISTTKNHKKGFMYNLLHCWLGTGLLTSKDEKWRTRRKMLTPSFHFNILQQFLNVFNDHTSNLIKEIKENINKETDVVPIISHYTLDTICALRMEYIFPKARPIIKSFILQLTVSQESRRTGFSGKILSFLSKKLFISKNNKAMTTKFGEQVHIVKETAMGTSTAEETAAQKNYMKLVHYFGEDMLYRMTNPWFVVDYIYALTTGFWKLLKVCRDLHKFSYKVILKREEQFLKSQNMQNGDTTDPKERDQYYGKKRIAMLDLLLLTKHKESSIDYEGIREEVDTFIFEGHDTTATCLTFTLMLLANNRDCQDKIVEEFNQIIPDETGMPSYTELQDLKYMEMCIKESLRLYPSVPLIGRESDGFITSEGYYVPKGCSMMIFIYDLHRNPKLYPDPEKFIPERFLPENSAKRHPYAYVPFSAGPRNCIGQKFAMMEVKSVLCAILKNFILEPIDTPETLTLIPHLVLKSTSPVRVKFVSRKKNQ